MKVNPTDIEGFFQVGHYYELLVRGSSYGAVRCDKVTTDLNAAHVSLYPESVQYRYVEVWDYAFNTDMLEVHSLCMRELACVFGSNVATHTFKYLGRKP